MCFICLLVLSLFDVRTENGPDEDARHPRPDQATTNRDWIGGPASDTAGPRQVPMFRLPDQMPAESQGEPLDAHSARYGTAHRRLERTRIEVRNGNAYRGGNQAAGGPQENGSRSEGTAGTPAGETIPDTQVLSETGTTLSDGDGSKVHLPCCSKVTAQSSAAAGSSSPWFLSPSVSSWECPSR